MIRSALASLLGFVLLFFAVMAIFVPFMLSEQAKEDQHYFQQFRAEAARVDPYLAMNRLPTQDPIEGVNQPIDAYFGEAPCEGFEKAAGDRYVLAFWRGEWMECYAHPSGHTTLLRSLEEQLSSGFWKFESICWVVAIACAVGMRIAAPDKKISEF